MTTIKLRRGTAAEWTTANPILAAGEMGIETDTRKFKFGDGTTPWNTLAYASAEGGGGTGDVTAAEDNYFTGNNTFTGTTKFDNDVNIHGANLEVAGVLEATTGNITNLQVPNTLTSSGEINAVSIKSTGIRSDDIQTTTNKKYLTEVDVDNQTIQVVDGKLHANLDNIPDPNLFKTPLVNSIFNITNISDLPIGETIINTSCYPTDNAKPYFGISMNNGSNWYVGINPGTANLFRVGSKDTGKETFVTLYKTYKIKIILNKISDTEIYAKGILYDLDNTTVLLESGFDNVSSGTTFKIYDYHTLNSNWISLAYDNSTLKVNESGQLYADIQTKQDILSDGNGTKVVDNKVDIYQGDAGINGLNLYQNNGTITKNNDLSITFNNGACGYIFLPNKGTNNDYEIVLHCNYLDKRGSARDSAISIVMCTSSTTIPLTNNTSKGGFTIDTYSSPFRCFYEDDTIGTAEKIISTINYQKVIIKGTTINLQVSEDNSTFTNICTVKIDSTNNIIIGISNRLWSADINTKWTNTTLFPDSYILDKTTNTYLMKQGISNDGVAVATSNKYGLVLPDNSTIVSNNGVISANLPDTSKFLDKTLYSNQTMQGSLTVNGGVTECQKFRMRSSGTGSIDYANTTLGKTMFVFRGVNGDYPILIGDSNQNIQIDSTKVLFNSPTLARKVDDSTEATIVDSSNVSTYATGLAFPSNRYIDLTPGANGTSYIAPADGWIAFAKKLTATGQFVGLSNNTTKMATMGCNATDGSGGNTSCFIPCKKGDEVVTWYSAGGDVLTLRFIYAEGVQ